MKIAISFRRCYRSLNINDDSYGHRIFDAPKNAWLNLKKSALDPKRDDIILERCVDARYSVRHDVKKSRNRMRYMNSNRRHLCRWY